jgi:hypothetical protein
MIESTPLKWILILVAVSTGVWFLFRGVRLGSGSGTADRISHLAHVLMAAAMAAMILLMG